jgi:predicted metal-dependent hydrolase
MVQFTYHFRMDISQIQIKRSARKNLSIKIGTDGAVIVSAPRFFPEFMIRRFVASQKQWIEKQLEKVKLPKRTQKNGIGEGDIFLLFGQEYTLQYASLTELQWHDGTLMAPRAYAIRIQKELTAFYTKKAREVIKKAVERTAQEMKTEYQDIYFSDTSSKWGSCSHDNILQFNWRLVMAPMMVIQYVVVHELAHTIEKNHSKAFWDIVGRYMPSYKQQRKWLKTHGSLLATMI